LFFDGSAFHDFAMSDLHMLFIGDGDRAEFREARRSLDALGWVAAFADVKSAMETLVAGNTSPDVIVVAQAYPGQLSHAEVDGLRRFAPLARVIALLGSWCEGEMRSGKPLCGVIRIYWHQWPARSGRELRRLLEGRGSAWTLPVTATEEERLLAAAEVPLPQGRGLIAIHTRSAATEEWLSAACVAGGYSIVAFRSAKIAPLAGPKEEPERYFRGAKGDTATVLFDAFDCQSQDAAEVRRLATEFAPAPVFVLADFLRIEDHQRMLAAGATAVLSKPLQVEDLLAALAPASYARSTNS
jgi:CheY-like chemotaxis protein